MPIMEELQPIVDRSIDGLANKTFVVDPIAGERYSRMVSVLSSAYKRHGHILERSLLERLRQNQNFQVWSEPAFQVSQGADQLVGTLMADPNGAIGSNINYGPGIRTLQTDLVVYDKEHRTISAYEVKRGSGLHDSGKKRSILRDTLCTQILLQSYAQSFNLTVSAARAYVIFYYGMRSIAKPFSLVEKSLMSILTFR